MEHLKIASAGTRAPRLLLRLINSLWMSRESLGRPGGVLEVPHSIGDGNSVYAPWPSSRNLSCRLCAAGGCAESVAKLGLESKVRWNRNNVRSETGALVYALGRVGPKLRLPSTRNRVLALPSTRRGEVWQNVVMSCILVVVFEGLGALYVNLNIACKSAF